MHPTDTPDCFASHMGAWACEPEFLQGTLVAIKMGMIEARAQTDDSVSTPSITVTNGVGIVPIRGKMMKGASKFGGTSTVAARRALRALALDNDVKSIMLHVDSPGGHVSGTDELASEVRRARESKPVYAHIDDMGASAAYWVASQAERITTNRAGRVGSIGTMAILQDVSGAMERDGVQVKVVRSAPSKALGADGAVTDELLDEVKVLVDHAANMFISDVRAARPFISDDAFSGSVFDSDRAYAMGLVDDVMSFDNALSDLFSINKDDDRQRNIARVKIARQR